MINEVSQGSGSSEYVEFVVIGNPVCEGEPIPCIDLRKVIFDDNNGFFASGSGTGIASGALRFSGDDFWSCVPQGTFIVVYNEASRNPALPADDLSLTDGNCTLVIPGNSTLLESTPLSPNTGDPLYPTNDSDWGPSQGWAAVSMNNTNDSFQIPNLGVNGTPLHSVSWGNNTNGAIIFFIGPATGQAISFQNTVSNNFNDQQNWVIQDIASGETPGEANSAANDLWIGTMNPNCRVNPALNFLVTNADCSVANGAVTLVLPAGADVSILWENGDTDETIDNLLPGTYSVTVTENLTGCTFTDSATVALNNSTLALNPSVTDESCSNLCDGTVQLNISGGQQPYTVIWTQNGTQISEPASFCSGTYSVSVTDANQCSLSEDIQVGTTTVLSYTISGDTLICAGDSAVLVFSGTPSVSWSTGPTDNSITVSPEISTSYTATISEGACTVTETISVGVSNCNLAVSFPNIFTPDGDNANDNYSPVFFSGVTNVDFAILNRWGNIVYRTAEQQITWDGLVDGKEASEGVYFYVCTYAENGSTENKTVHGFLHLKRE